MKGTAGFWSYAHEDDRAERQRITRLASAIQDEYTLLTGESDLEIFVDRANIKWGEAWRARINSGLTEITFFIPIVTPRYLKSQECRRELLVFSGQAQSLGVSELLLPILYIDVPGLQEDSTDEVVALLARTQYERWTDLRFEAEDSPPYRAAVNRLATRLRDIAETVNALPDPAPESLDDLFDEEEMGVLESAALGEEVIPQWVAALEQLNALITELDPIVTAAGEAMGRAPSSGAKLIAAQRFASDIRDVSARYRRAAGEYGSKMIELDPAILRIIRAAEESQSAGEDTDEYVDLFATIREVVEQFRVLTDNAQGFIDGIEGASRISRAVRPPLRDLRAGTQQVIDGQSILDEWIRRIDELGQR